MRAHPHLYEINTWPWLDGLSRRAGRHLTLAGVPDREWDDLQQRGINIVYLMGIWKRSAFGRQLARCEPSLARAFDLACPGWTARDCAGSAYCIAGYEPDRRVGTWEDLAEIRVKLHARAFRAVEAPSGNVHFIACGRDPCVAPWSDVARLDYSKGDTRAAMIDVLERLARHADGARCDMAMLVLSDVFNGTWKDYLQTPVPGMPAREFCGRESGRAQVHPAGRGLLERPRRERRPPALLRAASLRGQRRRVSCRRVAPARCSLRGGCITQRLDGQQYRWSRNALSQGGLYVKLEKGAAHILRVV
jgi:hypothetical protein